MKDANQSEQSLKSTPTTSEVETIDLATSDPEGLLPGAVRALTPSIDHMKENSATWVAIGVLALFLIFVVLFIGETFSLLKTRPSSEAKAIITDAVIPVIKEIGNFSTSVFAPLLAFILGYYFSEKKRRD